MRAYFDAFSGISGDMTVGALLDLGLSREALERAVDSLGLDGSELTFGRREYGAIRAATFSVRATTAQPERTLAHVREILLRSSLPKGVIDRALATFQALAEAEGKVHGVPADEVHFHEVGSLDAIVDVVGAALGVETLGITAIHVSPLPLGSGLVETRHGPLPVPAPATIELLRGFVTRPGNGAGEMVTPTGAAILRGFGAVSGAPATLRPGRVGYGGGSRTLGDRPNVLRIICDDGEPLPQGIESDEMLVVECNIDDMNPEIYEHVTARLFSAGAADVTLVPAQMKKGRPAVIVQVLAAPSQREAVARVLFSETTTIGVRFHRVERLKLPRRIVEVQTAWGPVRVKIAGGDGAPSVIAPEYESCRAVAERHGVALRAVYEAALRAAR